MYPVLYAVIVAMMFALVTMYTSRERIAADLREALDIIDDVVAHITALETPREVVTECDCGYIDAITATPGEFNRAVYPPYVNPHPKVTPPCAPTPARGRKSSGGKHAASKNRPTTRRPRVPAASVSKP